MEAIPGPRPATEAAFAARTVTASSGAPALAGGAKAVTPAERSERPSARTSRASEDDRARLEATLREVVAELDARLPANISLDISYDETVKRTVVRGVSTITGETVIEFPTEKMLSLIRSIRDSLGVAVDERA